MTRRDWMMATAALSSAAPAAAQTKPKDVVIASANGTAACARAMQMLKSGADTLDAVVAGVNIVELDPEETSVGYGGLPNEEGVVELDASVMHGPSRRAGAVASIRGVKTPSNIAQLVMEQTDHLMLVGEGASRFARAMGYPEENLLTEKARLAWLVWKRSLRDPGGHNNWVRSLEPPASAAKPSAELKRMFPEASDELLAWAWKVAVHPPTGTINCLALNARGEMSGVTTTSGLAWKIPGRVGDSPIIGAGLYLDQDVGGAGSTGLGEENIRIAGGHTIVENMRRGMTPKEACLDALKRVARNFNDDHAKLQQFDLSYYALRRDGEYASASLWNGHKFAVNTGEESRLETSISLMQR